MKKIIAIMMILAVAQGCNYAWKSSDTYVRRHVLLLYSGRASCSAVEVEAKSGRVYTLTAGHCKVLVEDGKIWARDEDGKSTQITLIEEDPMSDLLILTAPPKATGIKIADKIFLHEEIRTLTRGRGMPTYKTQGEILDDREGRFGELIKDSADLMKCMMPKNSVILTLDGLVCITTETAQATTATIYPGSSGGPAVDSIGRLVGIASATDGEFSYFVKLSDIQRFMKGR